MNGFVPRPAAEELLAVLGEVHTVKTFLERGTGNHSSIFNLDNGHFMRAIAAVQDGGVFAPGMHGHAGGRMPDLDLFSDRVQKPLVGKQDSPTGELTGHLY